MKKGKTCDDTAVYQFDSLTGFSGIPNVEMEIAFGGPEGGFTPVKLNAHGYRDEPFLTNDTDNTILCYGGSHTWGVFLQHGERYTDILNRRFVHTNNKLLNLGNGSFGLDQIALSILNESSNFSPGVIVIEQFPWSLHRVLNPSVYGYLKPSFYIDENGELGLNKVPHLAKYKWYRNIVASYRLYKKELSEFREGVDIVTAYDLLTDPIFLKWKISYYQRMYLLVEKILTVIKDYCNQSNCKLVFLVIAYSQQFGNESGTDLIDYNLPANRFKEILHQLNIEYIDAAPELIKVHDSGIPVLLEDGHTNQKGHTILADILAEGLISRGWLGEQT